METLGFSAAIPIFRMFDEPSTRAFYVDFLEFAVDWEHRFDPDAPLYMQVSKDQCRIHLSGHHGDSTPGSGIRIQVTDLTAYNALLLAKRYKHARPGILDQTWGSREMIIDDPSGNRLVFYEASKPAVDPHPNVA
jgi:hypothetical protein